MNIQEIFENLIEIQSIYKNIQGHQSTIDEENKRLLFLKKQQQQKTQDLEEINAQLKKARSDLSELEEKCASYEENIEKSKNAQAAATSNTHLDSALAQMKLFQEKYQKESEQLFKVMEEVEALQEQQSEISGFLKNFNSTYLEIENEVKPIVNKESALVEELQKQINSVLLTCPAHIQSLFKNIQKKYSNPIIFVGLGMTQSCLGCHYLLQRSVLETIHGKKSLETCPNCQRILIPYNN